jgi:hypothetical protein
VPAPPAATAEPVPAAENDGDHLTGLTELVEAVARRVYREIASLPRRLP